MFKIDFIFFLFITYIIFLTFPIGLYNLYQSLPSENTIPMINVFTNNNYIIYFIIEKFTSLIIAIQQWFIIPFFVTFLANLIPITNNQNKNKRNFLIQLSRNMAFVVKYKHLYNV